jgi:hypothetical protein
MMRVLVLENDPINLHVFSLGPTQKQLLTIYRISIIIRCLMGTAFPPSDLSESQ